MRSYLSSNGISHLTTPPHTPQHNGLSERKHRHIVETGLSLLSTAKMPLTFWPEAFATAVYLINRMTTHVLQNQSPYQKLLQTSPNFGKLRTFGSLCYPWLRPYAPNKLENRSIPCVFVGYSLSQSAYLCLDPSTARVYTSRHVRFNETQFPYQQLRRQPQTPEPELHHPVPTYQPHTIIHTLPPLVQSPSTTTESVPPSSETSPPVTQPTAETAPEQPANTENGNIEPTPTVPNTESVTTSTSATPSEQPPPRHSMTTRSINNITKSTTRYNLTTNLQEDPHWIPITWQQAMKHPKWRAAMLAEFNSQVKNHTLDLEAACQGMNIVGCHWIFTIKYHPNGEID